MTTSIPNPESAPSAPLVTPRPVGHWYRLVRPLLFGLDAERVHGLTLAGLERSAALPLPLGAVPDAPCEVLGLRFPNPVGLAAGLDKDAICLRGMARLGFGFLEVGTVTPRPQSGNPVPRLFRLPEHCALINRMGFNNGGMDAMAQRLEVSDYDGILGINVGKNKDTPNESAASDYLACIGLLYPFASYITVNLSSPNTPGLRALQFGPALADLLTELKAAQARGQSQHGRYVPLVVKIAPDLAQEEIERIVEALIEHDIDGVIATNTTIARPGYLGAAGEEAGGLSGAPLTAAAQFVAERVCAAAQGRLAVIGVGGIVDEGSAAQRAAAGVDLVQLYSGLIMQGPGLVRAAAAGFAEYASRA